MTTLLSAALISLTAVMVANAQRFSLSTSDVNELQTLLQGFANGVGDYAKANIPNRVSFSGGYCKNLKLLKYVAPKIRLRRLSGSTIELKILNGLAEGEGYCKVCKKILWAKVCAKAKPLARLGNINFKATVRLGQSGGKPRLSLVGGCNLDVHFKIVKMRGKNFAGVIAGLFKKRISKKGEKELEKFGCKQINKAIAKANQQLCTVMGC